MAVRRTCAGVMMNDFGYCESLTDHYDAHDDVRHVQSIDYDDSVTVVSRNGDAAHDCNDCAVKRVEIVAIVSVIVVGRLSSMVAHSHVPHDQIHGRCRVRV